MPPIIDSDFSEIKALYVVPEGIYKVICKGAALGKGKKPPHNPWVQINTEVDEGEYAGSKISTWLTYSGVRFDKDTKQQLDIVPFQYAKFIEAAGIPWQCVVCNSAFRPVDFLYGRDDNGLVKGQLYCPDCRQPTRIRIDTDTITGKRVKIAVKVQKQEGTDKDVNSVTDFAPIEG